MAWQAVGSVLGALLSLGASFGSSGASSALLSEKANKRLMKYQYDLNRQTRQTSFQDTRADLESAGYNPLLAVGQQSNGGSFGSSMSVQDPKFERMQNMLSAISTFSQNKLNSAQAYNQIMQGKLTNSQAYNLMTQSHLNSAQTGLSNLQSQAQIIQNLHLPSMLKSQILLNNNTAQANMINANANQVSAQANQMNAISNRMNANTNSAVGASTAWRNFNQSLGYTTSTHVGPLGVSFSHTGNPNAYTQGVNPKGGSYYRTEYINGKPIQVKVIR